MKIYKILKIIIMIPIIILGFPFIAFFLISIDSTFEEFVDRIKEWFKIR